MISSPPSLDAKALAQQFKEEGFVVLKSVLDQALVADILRAYDTALNNKMARLQIKPVEASLDDQGRVGLDFKPEGGNHDMNRWNMHLPSTPDFLREEVFANPAFLPIIQQLLGKDCVNIMLASDTPLPGASYQSYHQDLNRMAITVNIALRDVGEHDSPLEIIPKTHRALDANNRFQPYTTDNVKHTKDQIKWASEQMETKRLTAPAGSVIIRDQRMIHRGTAHDGTAYRPLLALWYKQAPTGNTDLSTVTIPVPHRKTANRVAKKALAMRNAGRSKQNKEVINIGSLIGRVVDETSCTDRDYRRVIPQSIWKTFSPEAKQLLRYAEVEGGPTPEQQTGVTRSGKGDFILKAFSGILHLYRRFV